MMQDILLLHCKQYLKSNGWKLVDSMGESADIWENSTKEFENIQILLPLDPSLNDYNIRMEEFIETLRIAERRSRNSILSDLKGLSVDKFRVSLHHPKGDCVKLLNASKVIERSVDMLAAAANSLIEPKPFYHSRYPKQVQQYIDSLELGHTEQGSFVFKIHSPVTPALLNDTVFTEDNAPFARRTMCQLVEILKTSIMAANRGGTKHFADAVKQGVSSNFCEALADIAISAGSSEVSFNFNWSLARPCPLNVSTPITIRRDIAEVLKEASCFLRTSIPEEGAEVRGYVVGLDKDRLQTEGEVKIIDITDGQNRSVFLKLAESQYQEALLAHAKGNCVSAIGNIEKKYKKSIMTNIIKFSTVDETVRELSFKDELEVPLF